MKSSAAIRKRRVSDPPGQAPPLFQGMGELAQRARERKDVAANIRQSDRLRSVADGPSVSVLKESPEALAAAIRRAQVKRIARNANPLSPDTEHVFTAGGARYAKTGLYSPTAAERAAEARRAIRTASEAWWDKHRKAVVIGALSVTAGFLLYSVWKNAELRRRLDAAHGPISHGSSPYRTGYDGTQYGYEVAPTGWQEGGPWQPWYEEGGFLG